MGGNNNIGPNKLGSKVVSGESRISASYYKSSIIVVRFDMVLYLSLPIQLFWFNLEKKFSLKV